MNINTTRMKCRHYCMSFRKTVCISAPTQGQLIVFSCSYSTKMSQEQTLPEPRTGAVSLTTSPTSKSSVPCPSLTVLSDMSSVESRLESLLPFISRVTFSLNDGKRNCKLHVSWVVTATTWTYREGMLKKPTKMMSIAVAAFLNGAVAQLLLLTDNDEIICKLLKLRSLGWKHWKVILILRPLSTPCTSFAPVSTSSSASTVGPRQTFTALKPPSPALKSKAVVFLSYLMKSNGGQEIKLSSLKNSPAVLLAVLSRKYETKVQSHTRVDTCNLSQHISLFLVTSTVKSSIPGFLRREKMLSSAALKNITWCDAKTEASKSH